MGEAEIRATALFFFFAFLDDRRALEASTQALSICFEKKKKNPQFNNAVLTVLSTYRVWSKHHLKLHRGKPTMNPEIGWMIPTDLDLGPWREFQKLATQDELLAVIWSKILGISDHDIAQGLGISEGTVRYRLGRALRKLGSMAQGVTTRRLAPVK